MAIVETFFNQFSSLLERDLLPDFLIRMGIKYLLGVRLRQEKVGDIERQQEHLMDFVEMMRRSPIAVHTEDANQQHYEVPTEFFRLVLGKHMKYSSAYWKDGVGDLDRAEEDMLALTCERAELRDGHRILELGCGWGSLSLFMAAKYTNSRITVVSNSRTQKEHIEAEAVRRSIKNLKVITEDMNHFRTEERFDRVVSVEMFEHMRNFERLMDKVASFLDHGGKMFIHIFTHKDCAYLFEVKDETDWMSKYFFTGGMMPSDHLMLYFTNSFQIEEHWRVSGLHYKKTSDAWLERMDRNRDRVMQIMAETYGKEQAIKWWVYWRVFFMSCSELWGYKNGEEWLVSHYRFKRR